MGRSSELWIRARALAVLRNATELERATYFTFISNPTSPIRTHPHQTDLMSAGPPDRPFPSAASVFRLKACFGSRARKATGGSPRERTNVPVPSSSSCRQHTNTPACGHRAHALRNSSYGHVHMHTSGRNRVIMVTSVSSQPASRARHGGTCCITGHPAPPAPPSWHTHTHTQIQTSTGLTCFGHELSEKRFVRSFVRRNLATPAGTSVPDAAHRTQLVAFFSALCSLLSISL